MIFPSMMKIQLGRLVITPAALLASSTDDICRAIDRHVCGQWGDVSEDERAANELALSTASRVLSVHHTPTGTELRVITTGDRFSTTVYLPSDRSLNS
jgi:hypothetical protein